MSTESVETKRNTTKTQKLAFALACVFCYLIGRVQESSNTKQVEKDFYNYRLEVSRVHIPALEMAHASHSKEAQKSTEYKNTLDLANQTIDLQKTKIDRYSYKVKQLTKQNQMQANLPRVASPVANVQDRVEIIYVPAEVSSTQEQSVPAPTTETKE